MAIKVKDSDSNRREKFLENLKSRPVNDNSGFLSSRPLGCGLEVWVILVIFIGVILSVILTAFSLEKVSNYLAFLDRTLLLLPLF